MTFDFVMQAIIRYSHGHKYHSKQYTATMRPRPRQFEWKQILLYSLEVYAKI